MTSADTTKTHANFWRFGRAEAFLWLAVYVIVLSAIVLGVLRARDTTLGSLGTAEARADWQNWRDAPPNQDQDGPVKRRAPSTDEPPALILMRDHFSVVMFGGILFGSLLFAALMFVIRGVLKGKHPSDFP